VVYLANMSQFNFNITKKLPGTLARVGEIHTPNGIIHTPSFVTVGTKATVKALTPEQVKELGAQVVLANTYHLYLEPGDEIVAKAWRFSKNDELAWTDDDR
jgi:queuine tRNA-ribosyltransferase